MSYTMVHNLPSQSFTAWRVCMTLLHILAVLSTVSRVSIRWRMAQMWWDDYMVFLPTITDIYFCATLWAYPAISKETLPFLKPIFRRMWISTFPTTTVVWLSRICTLLSLGRVFPFQHPNRQTINWLIALFATFYITCVVLTAVQCDFAATSHVKSRFCLRWSKTYPVLTFSFTTDVISDIILLVCPMVMLWKIRFPSWREKRMVLVALSTSIFTTLLLSIIAAFAYGPFKKDISYIILVYMLAHMVAAVALFSCNLLVVASAIYRAVRSRGEVSPRPGINTSESEKAIPITLTEIDLAQDPQICIQFLHPPHKKLMRRHTFH